MTTEVLVEKKKLEKPPLQIHTLGDRVLRQPAKRVSRVDNEIRQLAKEMLQTMYSADGIGLAAPQVGVLKQLLVIDCKPDETDNQPVILLNPSIKKFSGELCLFQEGCLSIPGVFLDVKRPEAIEVSYKDVNGRPQTLTATGLLARVIQHELDHLNAIMFVDRVENMLALNQELAKNGFSAQAVKPVA